MPGVTGGVTCGQMGGVLVGVIGCVGHDVGAGVGWVFARRFLGRSDRPRASW